MIVQTKWTALLERVATVLLAAAFLVATLPLGMASAPAGEPCPVMEGSVQDVAGTAMLDHAKHAGTQYKTLFDCPQTLNRVAVQFLALPDAPSIAVTFDWTPVAYSETDTALSGRTVRPDLFPPIALV